MDGFFDFLVSINKIALFAFFAVLGFLVYEIKKMMEDKKKKEVPVVPQFDNIAQVQSPVAANSTSLPPIVPIKKAEKQGNSVLMISIGAITLVGVTVLLIVSYNTNMRKQKVTAAVPIVREITSAGLKVYDTNWEDIEKRKNDKAKPGEKLYIGIQTIVEADIDRARIKVNTQDWRISDITTLFNSKLKVYYKEYIVATGTAQLKIQAQLHSASDGWLGD